MLVMFLFLMRISSYLCVYCMSFVFCQLMKAYCRNVQCLNRIALSLLILSVFALVLIFFIPVEHSNPGFKNRLYVTSKSKVCPGLKCQSSSSSSSCCVPITVDGHGSISFKITSLVSSLCSCLNYAMQTGISFRQFTFCSYYLFIFFISNLIVVTKL